MKAIFVKLQCITNLHVGNGDVNYNIIDNEVERDPVTNLPTINSSGIKGALRQYFTNEEENYPVSEWFGNEDKDKEGNALPKSEGKLKFLPAEFIAQPLRASKGSRAFYMATTGSAISRYEKIKEIFLNLRPADKDFPEKNSSQIDENDKVELEGIRVEKTAIIAGEKVYRLKDKDFKNISLPVMARNKLENGISKNLWYEEVVPHESIFVFPVVAHDCDVELLKDFKKAIEGKMIQFGGNASIGEGLCLVTTAGRV